MWMIFLKPGATASIEAVEVTSEVEPDNELAAALEKYTGGQKSKSYFFPPKRIFLKLGSVNKDGDAYFQTWSFAADKSSMFC